VTATRVATALVYPTVMTFSVLLAYWGLANGYSAGTWGFFVTVSNMMLVALIEELLPMRAGYRLLRDRQIWNDIGHGVLLTTVGRPLGAGLSVLGLAAIGGATSERFMTRIAIWPNEWSFAAQLALALAIYSFLDYWKHRAYHSIDALWWIHAIHHDTNQMHVLKAGRLHLLEGLIRFVLVTTPLMLLGAPTPVFVWVGLFMNFEGNLNHSNAAQRFPSWFHYLVPTVQVHHVHHARERRLQDSNFSGVTSLWDVAFGTFRHPDDCEFAAYGLSGERLPPSLFGQLLYPLRRWLRRESLPDTQAQPPQIT